MTENLISPSTPVTNGAAVTTANPMPVYLVGGIAATSIAVGSTLVNGGVTNQLLYDNAGVLGEITKANSSVLVTNGSGVPSWGTALPNGTTATTQSASDNSTKVATTAYVDAAAGADLPLAGGTMTGRIVLRAGSTVAGTSPLLFQSGSLLTSPVAGAMEFLTDAWYATITTGPARKTFAFLESPSFTTPALGVATATSLALGGATIGSNALAVTGTVDIAGGASLAPFGISSTDAGAALGPIFDSYRNSASPAAADIIGGENYTGNSSTGVKRTYASIQSTIVTTTNTAEDGSLKLYTMKAGTLTNNVIVGGGTNALAVVGISNFAGAVIDASGNITAASGSIFNAPGGGYYQWGSNVIIRSAASGVFSMLNGAQSAGGIINVDTDNVFKFQSRAAADTSTINVNTMTITGAYTSGTPNGGTSGAWKMGIRVAATVILDTTQYLQVDVGGTLYKVAIAS